MKHSKPLRFWIAISTLFALLSLSWKPALASPKMASTDAQWSPDSKHIVYIAMPDRGDPDQLHNDYAMIRGERHLYIMKADGSERRRLAYDPHYYESSPKWSKRGDRILFGRNRLQKDEKDEASDWSIGIDGKNLKLLRKEKPKPL